MDLAFDGANALLHAWRDGLTPDPDLSVSAWADRHRVLSPCGANEAGPWRTSRTPYLQELMDALSPRHPAQRVVFMKGSQLGASENSCEVAPFRGTTGASVLIGYLVGSVLLDHATRGVCCGC
ncbi:MAG: phage terminase large subunit family protein [Defluviicoccus sp.]|nr:MAG: phage terminase large subunit family protein [Defluviicoccus sp.]